MKITLTKEQAYTIMTACDCAKYDDDVARESDFERAFNAKLKRICDKLEKAIKEDEAK